jgi:hypothetical protein
MADEVVTEIAETVKKMSDGTVNISIEKYEALVEKVADKDSTIRSLRDQLFRARNEPPVINRTVVHKTAEMLAQEHRAWGVTLMGLGTAFFGVGALRYKAGRKS